MMKNLFSKINTFSIRKLNIGTCSVIIGAFLLSGVTASADEVVELATSDTNSLVVTDDSGYNLETTATTSVSGDKESELEIAKTLLESEEISVFDENIKKSEIEIAASLESELPDEVVKSKVEESSDISLTEEKNATIGTDQSILFSPVSQDLDVQALENVASIIDGDKENVSSGKSKTLSDNVASILRQAKSEYSVNSNSVNSDKNTTVMASPASRITTLSSSSSNVTREEVVEWAKGRIGRWGNRFPYGKEGSERGQCVHLIVDLAEEKFKGTWDPDGHAKTYSYQYIPSGWQRIRNSSGFIPEPGDIAVWTQGGRGSGHVAIVIEANASSYTVVEQNGTANGGKGTVAQFKTYNYNNYTMWGVIRPAYARRVVSPPSSATIEKNQHWYDLTDTVRLTASATNAESYYIGLDKQKSDGSWERIRTERVNNGIYEVSASQLGEGNYSAYMSIANSAGSLDTHRVEFPILRNPTIRTIDFDTSKVYSFGDYLQIKATVSNSKSIDFQFIDVNTSQIVLQKTTGWQGDLQVPVSELYEGTFNLKVIARTNSGEDVSNLIPFTIGNLKPSSATIEKNQHWYDLTDTVRLTASAKNAESYYVGLDKQKSDGTWERVRTERANGGVYEILASELGEGKYSAYMTVVNSAGSIDTEKIEFPILRNPAIQTIEFDTSKPYSLSDILVVKAAVNNSKSIDFLFIDTTTNQVVLRKTTDWRGDLSLPVSELYEGNFKLRIIAKTGSGEDISDNLKFIISNEKSRVVNKWVLDKATQHWYHYDASGELSKNTWVGGYYLLADGKMATNQWVKDSNTGTWYYVNGTGARAKNTWVGSYYLLSDGKMAVSQWIKDSTSGSWYYVNESGAKVKDTWIGEYYLSSDGQMLVNKWIKDSKTGIWYYVNGSGAKVKDTWVGEYYLSSDGKMAVNKWIKDSKTGLWYYVNSSGAKVKNTWIDGYYLSSDGSWVKNP